MEGILDTVKNDHNSYRQKINFKNLQELCNKDMVKIIQETKSLVGGKPKGVEDVKNVRES